MSRYVSILTVLIASAIVFGSAPLPCRAGENLELQGLVDELRSLAEKSRDERAADRWLQQALEDLVSKYDWPWRSELLFDDFSDGNFTSDPEWKVISGRFWVDASLGLRSRVTPKREEPARERPSDSRRDLGGAIFEALLESALKREEPQQREPRSDRDLSMEGPARIRLDTLITNSFSLETVFSVHNEPGVEGHFEITLLQDYTDDYGYSLSVYTGGGGLMDIYRLRRGQRELLNSSRLATDPGRGERHQLVWRQADNGEVEVFMNGERIMNHRDRAFRDDYRWLELHNHSGELGIRSVKVMGTQR